MNFLEKALSMVKKYPLCDHCLGRQFALLGHGLENDERGRAIKTTLTLRGHKLIFSNKEEGLKVLKFLAVNGFSQAASRMLPKFKKDFSERDFSRPCFLCGGAFATMPHLEEKALERLEKYEYNTFLVGIHIPFKFEERDDELKAEFKVRHGENIRNEFGRSIGKKISGMTGKTVDFRKPDVVVLVDPVKEIVSLQVNPLYISGRYRKLARGMPQSTWSCPDCEGEGCKKCGGTGKLYSESVTKLIEKPFLDTTEGDELVFHATGRENIESRMLGKGRPFALEIKNPRKRFLNLKKIEDDINIHSDGKIEVLNLNFTTKDNIRSLEKTDPFIKEYLLIIKFKNKVTSTDLEVLNKKLSGVSVKQRTPRRLLHRKPDSEREKYIYRVKLKKLSAKKVKMKVRCQGGLYVKELVTGDGGRTIPSVSQTLDNEAKPLTLDVLNVVTKGVENN